MKRKLNTVIVDDEQNGLENISFLLQQFCPEVELVGSASNIEEAEAKITQLKPDLLFLDIQIGTRTIFELLNNLDTFQFEIIFVTAHETYAVEAFRYAAIDYLLKPISIKQLKEAVERVSYNVDTRNFKQHFTQYFEQVNDGLQQKIALSTNDGYFFTQISEIVYCEAQGSYTTVYLKDESKLMVSKNLKFFESVLTEHRFYRVHNSFLVNLNLVNQFARNGLLVLYNGAEVPVSRSRKDNVLKALQLL